MKEEFHRTIKELKEEIQKNNEQIKISEKRKRKAKNNQFEEKFTKTLGSSLLPYLGFLILSEELTKNGIMLRLIEIIPVKSFPFIIVGSSLCIGTLIRKIFEQKFKIKEALKASTTAKNQSEKIQEEVKYTIELEKAKNRNKAIQQSINSLSSNLAVSNFLSIKYDINDKNKQLTEENAKKRVEVLSVLLKDKFTELDVLTIQKILHEKFWRIRSTSQKIIDIIIFGMMGGLFTMTYGELPILVLKDFIPSLSTAHLFTPFFVGATVVSGYMIKRNKDYLNAFKNLNNELGKNSISNRTKELNEEQQALNSKIENKIRKISIIISKLQEQKRFIESILENSTEKVKTIDSTIVKKQSFESTKKNAAVEYNQENLMPSYEDIFTEVKKLEMETKGHSLVLRRNFKTTQNL